MKAVFEKLPEVELIDDDEIRNEVIICIDEQDKDYFWEAPATTSDDYHNPYCRHEYGLWIHTKMVCSAYERFVDSYVEQELITEREADIGRAACILHDFRKYGQWWSDGKSATYDHGPYMADLLRERTELPSKAADAIASHMGPWYEGPEPQTPLEQLVHQADMSGSAANGTYGIYKPHSDITDKYPDIPRAKHES